MNILVIGSGAREYSIGLALKKDKNVENIYFAPGNGATSQLGSNINYNDYDELITYVKKNGIHLTIVGPEAPLVEGIVNLFKKHNLKIFGPTKAAAQLEGSKAYMKNFLVKYNIATAPFIETNSIKIANEFIDSLTTTPIVIKADGLCAGKGVIIAKDKNQAKKVSKEMLNGTSFGAAGKKIIIEEFLNGYELSIFAVCDGENFILFPAAQDYKQIDDGNKGPNTGGMGAYAPVSHINELFYEKIKTKIITPTLKGMQNEKAAFEGTLFIGIMVVNNEPIVLEYNVRFGDPECEVLLPLMQTPASQLFYKAATKELDTLNVIFSKQYAVGVVMASANYPYKESLPAKIIINDANGKESSNNTHISFAGVCDDNGTLMATKGRVLVCVGLGNTLKQARNKAYLLSKQVHFKGKKLRNDIAYEVSQEMI